MNYKIIIACMLTSCMAPMQGAASAQSVTKRAFGAAAVPAVVNSVTKKHTPLVDMMPELLAPLRALVLGYVPELCWDGGKYKVTALPFAAMNTDGRTYSPDRSHYALVVESDNDGFNDIHIIETATEKMVSVHRLWHFRLQNHLFWSPGGRFLSCAGPDGGQDGSFFIMNPFKQLLNCEVDPLSHGYTQQKHMYIHDSMCRDPILEWSDVEEGIYAFIDDSCINIYDARINDTWSKQLVAQCDRLRAQYLVSRRETVLWHPNGNIIAVLTKKIERHRSEANNRVTIVPQKPELSWYDIRSGRKLHTITIGPSDRHSTYNDAAFSPNGSLIILAHDKGVAVYDVATGKLQRTIALEGVTDVIWLSDEIVCACARVNKSAHVINSANGAIVGSISDITETEIRCFKPYYCGDLHPRVIEVCTDTGSVLWEPDTDALCGQGTTHRVARPAAAAADDTDESDQLDQAFAGPLSFHSPEQLAKLYAALAARPAASGAAAAVKE